MQDEEPFAADANDFPEDVVESLRILEVGGSLPAEQHATEPEDGTAFVARMDKLIARYEAQFLKKSQQKVGQPLSMPAQLRCI